NKCVSYLTIEYRGKFSSEQEKMIGSHVYGCDVCQEVCPYNDRIPSTSLPEFQPREDLKTRLVSEQWDMTEEGFHVFTEGTAMERIRYSQWLRNLRASGI